jgi:lysophospholipase L1-like esterase
MSSNNNNTDTTKRQKQLPNNNNDDNHSIPVILLFGDSITEFSLGTPRNFSSINSALHPSFPLEDQGPGWSDLLTLYFMRRLQIINRGYAGYNTDWALQYGVIPSTHTTNNKVELTTLWFGANDAISPDKPQHVPLGKFSKNLIEIIHRILKFSKRLIILTPPPIDRDKYEKWKQSSWFVATNPSSSSSTSTSSMMVVPNDRSNELVKPYIDEIIKIVQEQQQQQFSPQVLQVINVFNLFNQQQSQLLGSLVSDGLHLSAKGEMLIFQTIIETLQQTWPEMIVFPDPITKNYSNSGSKCEHFIPRLPWWDQIDSIHYKQYFNTLLLGEKQTSSSGLQPLPASSSCFNHRPKIICLGDSITQQGSGWYTNQGPGWVDLLTTEFARRVDVLNCGLNGYNSRWVLAGWDLVLPFSPVMDSIELVTIFFGANDAGDEMKCNKQHVPLAEYEANLTEIIHRVRTQWKAKRIVVIGPTPIHQEKYLIWRRNRSIENQSKSSTELLDRSSELVYPYSLAAQRVAKKEMVGFLDLFHIFNSSSSSSVVVGHNDGSLFSDGLHLSHLGNWKLYEELSKILNTKEFDYFHVIPESLTGRFAGGGSQCKHFDSNWKLGEVGSLLLPWFEKIVEEKLHTKYS